MDLPAHDPTGRPWTGELKLDLRNGHDWSASDADISVHLDTVHLRHANRGLAILDRDRFRDWLIQTDPTPLVIDDVVWWVQVGITFFATHNATFRVGAESLSNLLAVI